MALSKVDYNSLNVTAAASKALKWNSGADGFETGNIAGSLVLLATETASSSATINFTDNIDDTYDSYLFKFINCHASNADVIFQFNMSIDGGSNYNVTKTTTDFVAYHREDDGDTNFDYYDSSDLAQSTSDQYLHVIADLQGINNDDNIAGEMRLFNPSSTVFVKHFMVNTIFNSVNVVHCIESFIAGHGNTTSAINAVQFKMSAGNIDAGVIKMYGVT